MAETELVFVIDDDESVRTAVANLLESVNLRAQVFASTEEFFKIARPSTPCCLVLDVQLPVSMRFGETEMVLEEIVKLGVGSVIELNSGMDQPVELVVNNRILARGEVVTVDGFYGIRITEITSAGERFKSLHS